MMCKSILGIAALLGWMKRRRNVIKRNIFVTHLSGQIFALVASFTLASGAQAALISFSLEGTVDTAAVGNLFGVSVSDTITVSGLFNGAKFDNGCRTVPSASRKRVRRTSNVATCSEASCSEEGGDCAPSSG